MKRRKWIKVFTIVSIISYMIAFFTKIIGAYCGMEYFIAVKIIMIFVLIGAISSGAIGILSDKFLFKSFDHKSAQEELTSEEIVEIKKLIEERYKDE